MIEVKQVLERMEVLQGAAPATIALLAACGKLKRVKKGQHLFYDKDEVDFLYFLAEGKVALYKFNNHQNKKVIFIYGKGNLLNEVILQEAMASVSCELLEDSLILFFPRQAFLQAMAKDFALAKAVLESMALKIRRLYHQLENTSYNFTGDKRIASKLWKLSLDHGTPCDSGIEIDLDMTITYFADVIGSKRETVSRQLKVLTDQGLVIFKRNRFIIPDRDKLLEYIDKQT